MRPRSTSGEARTSLARWGALALLLASAIGTQVALDGVLVPAEPAPSVSWVRSTALARRLAPGVSSLLADVYWIRAVQYYGDTKLGPSENRTYELLYPLLDMTTALDPHFNIAYRFGAILLSEGYPNGPGQTDEAITLLKKGIREMPHKWQYYHDAGFVEYWWRADSKAAADWFLRGANLATAPNWLRPLAASVLAEGGVPASARALWTDMAKNGEHEWLRQTARRGLMQLDAEAQIAVLQPVVNRFYDQAGRFPTSWLEMVRAGLLRGTPVDPAREPYSLDPVSGAVDVAKTSSLYPLRRRGSASEIIR